MADGKAKPIIDRELTDEEIMAVFLEKDEAMPDLPVLIKKHLSDKTIMGLTPEAAEQDDQEIGDDVPDDPWFDGTDVDEVDEEAQPVE